MTEKRLNNCSLLHSIHKDLVDSIDVVAIARGFTSLYDDRRHYLNKFCKKRICS